VTAASAAPAPTVAAFDPARPAPAAWGAPEPSLPLVPPGAQPITRRPREAHPWPERTTLEVPSVRDSPAAALQAVDVAELLAAALEDECDLRGVAR
jgi:hypothetical protein